MQRYENAITEMMASLKYRQQGPLAVQTAGEYIRSGNIAHLKSIASLDFHWDDRLAKTLPAPDLLNVYDCRALHILLCGRGLWDFRDYSDLWMVREPPGVDYTSCLLREAQAIGLNHDRQLQLLSICARPPDKSRVTSGMRHIVNLHDNEIKRLFGLYIDADALHNYSSAKLVAGISQLRPERLSSLAEHFLYYAEPDQLAGVAQVLLEAGFEDLVTSRYHSSADDDLIGRVAEANRNGYSLRDCTTDQLHAHFRNEFERFRRVDMGLVLAKHNMQLYGDEVLTEANGYVDSVPATNYFLASYGERAIPAILTLLGTPSTSDYVTESIIRSTASALGPAGLPIYQAMLAHASPSVVLVATSELAIHASATEGAAIQDALSRLLKSGDSETMAAALTEAAKWNADAFEEQFWKLTGNKSKQVRTAAARALSALGARALDRAGKLLDAAKADSRVTAAQILEAIGSPEAEALLEKRLDVEEIDEVRDRILSILQAGRRARGHKLTRVEVEANIERAKNKIKWPVATWINDDTLPGLRYTDGSEIPTITRQYLLSRQASVKEVAPCLELLPLYELIDRKTSGEFALALWSGFAGAADTKQRWVLTVIGMLGDDRLVRIINTQINKWVDANRGKLAEYAVSALALLGSDTALMMVDSLAMRYRSKMKNVGSAAREAFLVAAERAGMSPEELGDRIVPWLGFDAQYPRVALCGATVVKITVSTEFKLSYWDVAKKKPIAALPASAPPEIKTDCKELSALMREVAKAQILRHEVLMVRQYGWPAERWSELYLKHPLLRPFGIRLVWGVFDESGDLVATFRALDDGSLASAEDDAIELPDAATVRILHPLALDEATLRGWIDSLADYEIAPPFPQLERPVINVKPEQRETKICADYKDTDINAFTFKGRAERLGWRRASVIDAGQIDAYWKSFPAAGADAFLTLDGMFIGVSFEDSIKLGEVFFVPTGSVKVASYTYDTPGGADDARILAFGDVPPIVFSEVMGDLVKIAGKDLNLPPDSE